MVLLLFAKLYAYEAAYIASGEELSGPWMLELKKEKEKSKDSDYNVCAVTMVNTVTRTLLNSFALLPIII